MLAPSYQGGSSKRTRTWQQVSTFFAQFDNTVKSEDSKAVLMISVAF
jgi:hypothetical protein